MGNKTEFTRFLARATIKPETKTGFDKTESLMVPLVQKAFPEMEPNKMRKSKKELKK
jgi:hypothetical protein